MTEIFIDVGAGFGENILREAEEHPEKLYIAVEPTGGPPLYLPKNISWINARVDNNSSLPFGDSTIDGISLDFVILDISHDINTNNSQFFQEETAKRSLRMITECLRVLKKNCFLTIREPRVNLGLLNNVFNSLNLSFSVGKISLEEARKFSVSSEEMAAEFEDLDDFPEGSNFEVMVLKVVKQ